MKIESIHIRNFKFIKELTIEKLENACILIGRNSTGKTVILDAILAACGMVSIEEDDFNAAENNIEITIALLIEKEDMNLFHQQGRISKYKRRELWESAFYSKLPSLKDGILTFTFIANKQGTIRYYDGYKKNNTYISQILPKLYYIDHRRDLKEIENAILQTGIQEKNIQKLKDNKCIFDDAKNCTACFQCIGMIEKKLAGDLSIVEAEKLLEYKMLHLDMTSFMSRLNECFKRNSGLKDILVNQINVDLDAILQMEIVRYRDEGEKIKPVSHMSEGMKSIYILSLLEAYMQEENKLPCIIMMEDPEMFLHPQLQKVASEVLYRLSMKNQVIFSTHSPTMIFNFNSKQIKQVQLDQDGLPVIREQNDIGRILNDLGYSANDSMNVSFVFIVEGKQDRSRLPLLLNKYYSEIYDKEGRLQRISIVTTNSCTNIKTYANLKYINQLYLKDQFLMIRDGDGKNRQELKEGLCSYYREREKHDKGNLPRVKPENVLVLKYYSFENYFLNPKVMQQIGILKSEEEFYQILYEKYCEYLYRIKSFQKMREKTGIEINSIEDIKRNLETILVYGRGHNLFDIFYGKYRKEQETEILKQYIDTAEREIFGDILEAIDKFVYFDSRKRKNW